MGVMGMHCFGDGAILQNASSLEEQVLRALKRTRKVRGRFSVGWKASENTRDVHSDH